MFPAATTTVSQPIGNALKPDLYKSVIKMQASLAFPHPGKNPKTSSNQPYKELNQRAGSNLKKKPFSCKEVATGAVG